MSDEIKNEEVNQTVAPEKNELLDEIRDATYNVGDVGESEEEDDIDAFDDGRLLTGQKYKEPEEKDKFIDTAKGELVDKTSLTDFDVIKAVAKQNNVEVRNPRSGCKKCYGRGFIGKDYVTKAPIPCSCIYPVKTEDQKLKDYNQDQKNMPVKFNRKMLTQLKKLVKTEKKLANRQKIAEEQRLSKIEG